MTSAQGPRISVRGVATRLVTPDEARIGGTVEILQPTREAAHGTLAHAADWIVAQLAALGGAVQTVENRRAPLSWLLSRPSVHERIDTDEHGRPRPAGFQATQPFSITVRDLPLVDRIVNLLRTAPVTLWSVDWTVDDDNPAWREIRAEAIHAAIAKARDYAAALGAGLEGIEQVADTGLLGADEGPVPVSARGVRFAAAHKAGGGPELAVDPEPQEISATIEARVLAGPVESL